MKINKGDFIDSRQFSREECERFIELAVESGYTDAEGMVYYGNWMGLDALGVASSDKGRHVPYKHIGWGNIEDSAYGFCNNISRQFREFLDKENSMNNIPKDATHYGITSAGTICFYKLEGDTWYFLYAVAAEKGGVWCKVWDNKPSHTPLTEIKKRELGWCLAGYSYPSHTPSTEIKRQFTKADLLDGMRVTHQDGTETIVVGDQLWVTRSDNYAVRSCHISKKSFGDNLDYNGDYQAFAIIRVTDRDGTVVFEREQPKKKVTLELTDEQIAQVKAQFML